jgi:nucleotide-binding universal stress UspA family protein
VWRQACEQTRKENEMPGTVLCAITDREEGRGAVEVAAELSDRLDLRLVLASVASGISPIGDAEDNESVTMRGDREGAARLVAWLAAEYGLAQRAEQRHGVGDPAALLGQIAAEEAADVIVLGARRRGFLRRALESRLAEELASETSVPIVLAPPSRNGGRR